MGPPLDNSLESTSFASVITAKYLTPFLFGEFVTKTECFLCLLSVSSLTILPNNGFSQLYEWPDNFLNLHLFPQMDSYLSMTRTLY